MKFEDIKFKAYNKIDQKMYKVRGLSFTEEKGRISIQYDVEGCKHVFLPASDEETTLLPYIGFKDRNGKEIYEGDIISYDEAETYIVEWDTKTASFRLTDENNKATTGRMIHEKFIKDYEIIGNIYENSELLKGD